MVKHTPNVNEDDVLKWNCKRFLNRLQYIKDELRTEIIERDL